MNDRFDNLEKLEKLSEDSSSESRRQLLRDVTDVLLNDGADVEASKSEKFGEILSNVVFRMEMNIRQKLAETLATSNSVPHELIVQLANDEIEVARPVIEKSELLQDQDLIDIVKTLGQDHLLAVTVRPTVNEVVTDELVTRGNDTVLSSLAGNDGASISDTNLTKMVDRSAASDSLSETLSNRKNLPAQIEEELFLQLSGALKNKLSASDGDVSSDMIDQFLMEARNYVMTKTDGLGDTEAENFINRREKLGQLNTQLLQRLIRERKTSEFVVGLSRLVGIDLSTANRAVHDAKGERLAIICKAIGFDSDAFSNILALTDPDHNRSAGQNSELLRMYSRVPITSSQRAIRFLRTRQNLMSGK